MAGGRRGPRAVPDLGNLSDELHSCCIDADFSFVGFFFFPLLVKTSLKKVIDVKTKEMRVLSEMAEAVLQITPLTQSAGFTGQTRGSWGVLDALVEEQQQEEWPIS